MLDAQAVLAQARQGMAPPMWQIFVGKRLNPFLVGCFATFFTLFFVAFCGIFATIVTAIVFGISSGASYAASGSPFDQIAGAAQFAPLAAVLGLAIPLTIGFLAAARAARDRRDPDPLLVVTPDGFVEYVNSRKPVIAVAFADLADLRLRINTTRTTHYNQPGNPASGSYTTTSTAVWLDLLYRDGRTVRWRQRARFGQADAVVQSIIAAHGRYAAQYGMRYQPGH
jgi:hypothetical protein